jgi:hypothetical protein
MRLFNAGIFTSNFDKAGNVYAKLDDTEREKRDGCDNFLESYHYIQNKRYVEKIRAEGKRVFLDSGAYSAMSKGVSIDLGKYCDYIHENGDIIEHASVLDAIGDPLATWRNQYAMEQRGVNALPCYHYGEPTDVLDWYVDYYPYVTIGGMVPISTKQLIIWLDRIFEEHLCHPDGTPRCKVHGFGLTSLDLMFRYPWYSVDSSTWVQWSAFGMILIPGRMGQLDVSNKSSRRKQAMQHLDALPEIMTEAIETEIKTMRGEPDRLREHYYSRWAWNCWAFPEHARLGEHSSFDVTQPRLF